ncbi:MAG: cytochrome c [Alphaproteobacteria bacterium]|jgi:mono/diheme cytochrome c family protein
MTGQLRWILLVVAGAVAFASGAWLLLKPPSGPLPVFADAGDRDLVALGADIYAAQCASCHGNALEGQPNWRERGLDGKLPAPPHDATGHTWHHDDATLFGLTKYGPAGFSGTDYASDMPAYENVLSDREILAVLAYIKSTWPSAVRERQALISAQSAGGRS